MADIHLNGNWAFLELFQRELDSKASQCFSTISISMHSSSQHCLSLFLLSPKWEWIRIMASSTTKFSIVFLIQSNGWEEETIPSNARALDIHTLYTYTTWTHEIPTMNSSNNPAKWHLHISHFPFENERRQLCKASIWESEKGINNQQERGVSIIVCIHKHTRVRSCVYVYCADCAPPFFGLYTTQNFFVVEDFV